MASTTMHGREGWWILVREVGGVLEANGVDDSEEGVETTEGGGVDAKLEGKYHEKIYRCITIKFIESAGHFSAGLITNPVRPFLTPLRTPKAPSFSPLHYYSKCLWICIRGFSLFKFIYS